MKEVFIDYRRWIHEATILLQSHWII